MALARAETQTCNRAIGAQCPCRSTGWHDGGHGRTAPPAERESRILGYKDSTAFFKLKDFAGNFSDGDADDEEEEEEEEQEDGEDDDDDEKDDEDDEDDKKTALP